MTMPPTETQPTPTEWAAIVMVVEASLIVAQEWKSQLAHFGNILMRLASVHGADKIRIAIVAYGRSDTLPSPILCRRYFDSLNELKPRLPHGLMAFGVNLSSAGGSQGMAALDGLVAGLELFDHLRLNAASSGSPPKYFHNHLIHFTATGPDASKRPVWNDRVSRDNISWETLPDALKEGNINYSVFSARTISPRYQELHAAVNKEKSTPWFPLKAPTTILLAFFPKEGPKGGPTAQKPRTVTQPAESPKAPPMPISPPTSQRDVAAPTSTPSATNNSPAVSSTPVRDAIVPSQPQPPPQTSSYQQLVQQCFASLLRLTPQRVWADAQKMQATNNIIKSRLSEAEANGNTEEIAKAKADLEKIKPAFEAFGQYMRKITQAGMLPGSGPPRTDGPPQPPNPVAAQPVPPPVAPPFSMGATGGSLSTGNVPPSVQPNKTPVPAPTVRSVSESTVQPQPPSNISPMLGSAQLNNQLQKLVKERSERSWPPLSGGGLPIPNPNMGVGVRPAIPGIPNQPMLPNAPVQMAGASGQQANKSPDVPKKPTPIPIWEGTLNFKGTANGATQELSAYVTAATMTPTLARPETWPSDMHIVPTLEADIALPDIQKWIIASKAAWVTFTARHFNVPEHSDYAFNSLVQLLTTRKLFATAAWTTPSGGQTSNMFIFPVNGTNLVGACFPMAGIPNLPGNIPYPHPPKIPNAARASQLMHHAFVNMTKEQKEMLEKLAPGQRASALQLFAKKLENDRLELAQMQQQRQQQQQQQQVQQMATSSSPFGPGGSVTGPNTHTSPFGAGGMGMPAGISRMGNLSLGGGAIGGMMARPGGIGGGAVAGGMPANMFQPFMPRNEGGPNHGGA